MLLLIAIGGKRLKKRWKSIIKMDGDKWREAEEPKASDLFF